eukprot:TRINITY_DN8078_c0_g4_i1.p1 TRINITY_DN8078_c0_g4~~TRINITY_DN8078_c0_g4_i1.p1  ORF type:complete len:413 (-),score=41.18 TRINITY_DN8078_c0_g4_i1:161-1399(-)
MKPCWDSEDIALQRLRFGYKGRGNADVVAELAMNEACQAAVSTARLYKEQDSWHKWELRLPVPPSYNELDRPNTARTDASPRHRRQTQNSNSSLASARAPSISPRIGTGSPKVRRSTFRSPPRTGYGALPHRSKKQPKSPLAPLAPALTPRSHASAPAVSGGHQSHKRWRLSDYCKPESKRRNERDNNVIKQRALAKVTLKKQTPAFQPIKTSRLATKSRVPPPPQPTVTIADALFGAEYDLLRDRQLKQAEMKRVEPWPESWAEKMSTSETGVWVPVLETVVGRATLPAHRARPSRPESATSFPSSLTSTRFDHLEDEVLARSRAENGRQIRSGALTPSPSVSPEPEREQRVFEFGDSTDSEEEDRLVQARKSKWGVVKSTGMVTGFLRKVIMRASAGEDVEAAFPRHFYF